MKKCVLLFCVIFIAGGLMAQAPIIEYQLKLSGLNEPVDVVNAADGSNRLFIVQRGGSILIWNGSALLPNTFLNITSLLSLSGSERGLLSMAFHPDYKTNRYFFVYYTNTSGNLTLARYRTLQADPNMADPASGTVLLSITHTSNSNHNGAKLNFGADGFLYFGTGDGGGSNDAPNNAQNGLVLLGKMLRIDVNDFADVTPPLYSIPAGNPYISNAGVSNEIIALGLRNPFRWSFDRLTGDMWIGDVGQGAREEVDYRRADSILKPTNYGWRCLEGSITNPSGSAACPPPPDNVFPIFDYGHNASGGFVITGGYVYRGNEYPALYGYYICTDYASGNIWLIRPGAGNEWQVTPQTVNRLGNISSFGEDEAGGLYAVRLSSGSANTGALYKVITSSTLPVKLAAFTGAVSGNSHLLNWKIQSDEPGNSYLLERRKAGENQFVEIAKSVATAGGQQTYQVNVPAAGESYYRLKIIATNGNSSYSPVILLQPGNLKGALFAAYRSGSNLVVQVNKPARSVSVYTAAGALLYQQNLGNQTGYFSFPANHYKGIVMVRVMGDSGSETKKLSW